uniref:Uncharacterized protein n=1 Tax=Lepeophtheirus salmonis TaxID=72036 RepID=A0A0K2VHT9_LEPSM
MLLLMEGYHFFFASSPTSDGIVESLLYRVFFVRGDGSAAFTVCMAPGMCRIVCRLCGRRCG